ncbi:unnamed protein product [Gordionus sp. m RMFG-2023]|uniref:6-phosphogluconate dehydrogenase, decarboxylating-like n=1 Tax=Gordionus sp. m RMFG-2023 TaxID=3053472 RepID=UPI0030E16008
MSQGLADIGLVGLAVMGQNIVLNMNDHGFKVCVFNRTVQKVDRFLNNEAKGTNVIGSHSIEEFLSKLKTPKIAWIMVKAGSAVDDFINILAPAMHKGDIIIDGGNSEYDDTTRRVQALKEKGILYVGMGVSGGEDGARYGPSLMPGGNPDAWPHIKKIMQSISAQVDGEPCCDWLGNDGAGHFVKMVHNGIEYGDMQLISESYWMMKQFLKLSNEEIGQVFEKWNKTELDSYLIEITYQIINFKDKNGTCLIDKIRDSAGQKGTGKWTIISALNEGVPVTLIGEAVFARCLSALKDERVLASKIFPKPRVIECQQNKEEFIEWIRKALYASKIISYAQGFMLFKETSNKYKWELSYGSIAMMWRGGCIIRSKFLKNIKDAFVKDPKLFNLMTDQFFLKALEASQESWRKVVATAAIEGIPLPCFSAALAFYDGYRSEFLPANLIQAQRDFFGAHTYELLTKPGQFIHTNWTGHGGDVSSSNYNA